MVRLVCIAVGLGVAYGLLAEASFWFLQPLGGAAFFPPAGLALAVFVLTPRHTWPLWLVAFAAAHITVDLVHHRPVVPVIGYAVADMTEPVVGALLLGLALRGRRGHRVELRSFALFPVLLAPVIGAVVGASSNVILAHGRRSWWNVAWHWWIADALGVLVIGSLILVWARPTSFQEHVPIVAVAAVAVAGAAAIVISGVLWHYPLVYIAFPGLVWAAFVGGAPAVTCVGAGAALAGDWVAITGRNGRLIGGARPSEQLEFLQLFLFVTFLTGLVLAVEIAERRRGEQLTADARRQLAQSEQAAVELADAERQSIIRDTHDIVGHGLNAMLLQLGAARRLLDEDPEKAREFLEQTEAIGRAACDDLDVALTLVGHEPTSASSPGLDQLPELVSVVARAGLSVSLQIEGEPGQFSTLVNWSAYRIVREALTNVMKHAPEANAIVTVQFADDAIHLSVVDDGKGQLVDRPPSSGFGIISMRERAAAVGGTLEVGPNDAGGFTVTATLPTTRR